MTLENDANQNHRDPAESAEELARFEALLAPLCRDDLPADPPLLARLRESSTHAFLAAGAKQSQEQNQERRRRMTSIGLRAACAAAAVMVIGGWSVWWTSSVDATGMAFAQVWQQLGELESIHLQVNHKGKVGEAYMKGQVEWRWDVGDGTYKVVKESRQYHIDEPANRVVTHTLYEQRNQRKANLFDVLELPVDYAFLNTPEVRRKFGESRPVERVKHDGVECDVYLPEVPTDNGMVQLRALVNAQTHQLMQLAVLPGNGAVANSLAMLNVLAFNQQVDDGKFAVSDTLTEDGRVGKLTSVQGMVSLKPLTQQRWSPVCETMILRPGDWLRTDVRGANAVSLRLTSQVNLILGPNSLLEIQSPTHVRLHTGQVEVAASEKHPLELLGPGDEKLKVSGKHFYRLEKEKLARIEQEPLWLQGFKGTTANESLGSLVVEVDGRNVALTVGYHKVTVDVRDQIARTVIEESFVNHTNSRLEGVFHFPLPADASISGFGMWIGNDLVEADVVEKQRAREIYETILRERRDPGLLEWAEGNVFKARVFPIEAHSEKRIKITYTQVLPLRGNRYVYNYALQSDLLRQNPLRELSLQVKVASALPLARVSSPTHTVREQFTPNAASVEFTAQEYTPTRDFEVVFEMAGNQPDVVMIPHRRGEDGYFLLQLKPPAAGQWQREVLPDGKPLHVLIVADTSASLDEGQRATQADVIAAVLGALTPNDTFNVACCDVNCDWAFDKSKPANDKEIDMARQFVSGRRSLGWTDLDKAFAAAFQQAQAGTQIIYVGDGIQAAKEIDPSAFAARVKRLHAGNPATVHAVAVGNTYEATALKALGSLNGGSFRMVSGELGPQRTALELMQEITQPALRNLKLEFRGLRVARTYPEELPNLAAGTQLMVLGRYLPDGSNQQGEVMVTGQQGDQPMKYTARVGLADAEAGNSFIPRLWARRHLDALLAQGSSETVKQDIISLSEEYQIITPYTSFLVLESDADRERFKVKRTFRMRDGEKFFSEGRDQADLALLQQQMQRAGLWRRGLYRQARLEFAQMGRNAQLLRAEVNAVQEVYFENATRSSRRSGGFAGGMGGRDERASWAYPSAPPQEKLNNKLSSRLFEGGEELDRLDDLISDEQTVDNMESENEYAAKEIDGESQRQGEFTKRKSLKDVRMIVSDRDSNGWYDGGSYRKAQEGRSGDGLMYLTPSNAKLGAISYGYLGHYGHWFHEIFPNLPALHTPGKPKIEKPWAEEIKKIVDDLVRTSTLEKLQGGLERTKQTENFEPRRNVLASRSSRLELYSPKSWLVQNRGDLQSSDFDWCDGKQTGAVNPEFGLGVIRDAVKDDLSPHILEVGDYSLTSLAESYHTYQPAWKQINPQRVELTLTIPSQPDSSFKFVIDTQRHVVLESSYTQPQGLAWVTKYSDFVEVADVWWATKVETFDAKDRLTKRDTISVKLLEAAAFAERVAATSAQRKTALMVKLPLPTQAEAKTARAAGKAGLEAHLALLLHFEQIQQWERMMAEFAQCEALAADKLGLRWIRYALLQSSHKLEDLRKLQLAEAATLAEKPVADVNQLYLAQFLVGKAGSTMSALERLELLAKLEPVYARQPEHVLAVKSWREHRLRQWEELGRYELVMPEQKKLATEYSFDLGLQLNYARALSGHGDFEAANAWFDQCLAKEDYWLQYERDQLWGAQLQMLFDQNQWAIAVDKTTQWMAEKPTTSSPYAYHLSAWVLSDRAPAAESLAKGWIDEICATEKPTPQLKARAQAAVQFAMGQAPSLRSHQIPVKWFATLGKAAMYYSSTEDSLYLVSNLMWNSAFVETDECRQVRMAAKQALLEKIETLKPNQITNYLQWISHHTFAVQPAEWQKIAASLKRRWEQEPKQDVKHQLGYSVANTLRDHVSYDAYLAFLREQRRTVEEDYVQYAAAQLLQGLLGAPWTAELEAEAMALILEAPGVKEPLDRLMLQLQNLYSWTDRMVAARQQAAENALEHPEKLTRLELVEKRKTWQHEARNGVMQRLTELAAKQEKPLASWLKVEALFLQTLLAENLPRVADECWEILGPKPLAPVTVEDPVAERMAWLDACLRQRCLFMLAHLAVQSKADEKLVARVLGYVDQLIALDDAQAAVKNDEETEPPRREAGRQLKYLLLLALDRPKELEAELTRWTAQNDATHHWRLALGFVLAEQGRLAEAVRLFEQVEFADELASTAYAALADWYLVLNRREHYELASIRRYETIDEWQLHNMLSNLLNPWRYRNENQAPPTELDREVLLMFRAVFSKGSSLSSHQYLLGEYYRYTRDFRLLAVLADAMLGHTAGQVYGMLNQTNQVTQHIQEEATCDELVAAIQKAREKAKSAVDRRALDYLEMMVERRASELLNQPGPHRDRALAAMQRGFQHEWVDGEGELLAGLLAGLGKLPQDELAAEQLKQLQALHNREKPGTPARLHIAHHQAHALWSYNRRAPATDLLTAALQEYQTAVGGKLPPAEFGPLSTLITFLEGQGQYPRGEQMLMTHRTQAANPSHNWQLRDLLYRLYLHALQNKGQTSLGSGEELFQNSLHGLTAELSTGNDSVRRQLVEIACQMFQTAHSQKIPSLRREALTFANEKLLPVLKTMTQEHHQVVSSVSNNLYEYVDKREALAFLITRMEQEPRWFPYLGHDGWQQYGYQLAHWRTQVGALGDLEPRLLKLMLAALRRELIIGQRRGQGGFDKRYSYFWDEKAGEFLKVAEAVLTERGERLDTVKYVSEYLFYGLGKTDRAIEILFIALRKERLDEAGKQQLVTYLHETKRYGESIAVLQPMVETFPDNLSYRTQLMHAYFQTKRQAELLALLKETDERFHQDGRWNEGVMAALAESCLNNELYTQSVAYYLEVIPLHQRTAANQGIGDYPLPNYYSNLALAYQGLGKTQEAVDAACGAIVSWGPRRDYRANALEALRSVLRNAPKLNDYVAFLDAETQRTGLQNPIVRKALGEVYYEKQEYKKSIDQLKLALETQPYDVETHDKLLACYDAMNDARGAVQQLRDSLQLSRRDLERYRKLGERLTRLEQPAEAERAYTSMVEMQPQETESHTLLAKVRETQNRLPDALVEWQHVADLRPLEPTGLVNLARVQIQAKQWDSATESLRQLRSKTWHERFNNLSNELTQLQRDLDAARQ